MPNDPPPSSWRPELTGSERTTAWDNLARSTRSDIRNPASDEERKRRLRVRRLRRAGDDKASKRRRTSIQSVRNFRYVHAHHQLSARAQTSSTTVARNKRVADLHRECFGERESERAIAAIAAFASEQSKSLVTCRSLQEIVGYAKLFFAPFVHWVPTARGVDETRTVYVAHLGVTELHRKRGHGAAMLEHVKELAKNRFPGERVTVCLIASAPTQAERDSLDIIYPRCGFTPWKRGWKIAESDTTQRWYIWRNW